jgi:hypothetical protein
MKTPKPEKRLTALGYLISIGGMLAAAFLYFFLGIDHFFLNWHGVLGLSDISWAFVGGMIWLFGIMAIISLIVWKVGMETKHKD